MLTVVPFFDDTAIQPGQPSRLFISQTSTVIVFNPTPVAFTAVAGISITVPANTVARTVFATLFMLVNPSHLHSQYALDGAGIGQPISANTPPDSDGFSSQWTATGIPIPGDGATHTVTVLIAAQGSTAESDIHQCILSIIDVGA